MRAWSCVALLVSLVAVPLVAADSFSYHETWDRVLTEVSTPANDFISGANCVAVADQVHIVEGAATATWVAQSPLTSVLELVVYDWEAGEDVARVSGSSPLMVTFADVTASGSDPALLFAVQLTDYGVAVEQAFTLELRLDYEGDSAIEPIDAVCGLG